MSVHTVLMDFTVEPERVRTDWLKIVQTVETALHDHLPDIRADDKIGADLKNSELEVNQNLSKNANKRLLTTFSASKDAHIVVRGFENGLVTVNIEYFKKETEEPLFNYDNIKEMEDLIWQTIKADKSHRFPPIERGPNTNRYLVAADERILEYDIDKTLFDQRSKYQKVQIVHSKSFGNLLILDDLQNLAESDLVYTETLMQRGKIDYTDKEILILGGGDGALLYELLKEKPKFVTMLELDEVVMDACKIHLRSCCGEVLDNLEGEHYKIVIGDCIKGMDKMVADKKKVDFIFGDLTDIPVTKELQIKTFDFIKKVLNTSFQLLNPDGKYLTHGNGTSNPESLRQFEGILETLDVPVTFTTDQAFVPSFLENWVFYQVSSKKTDK